MHRPLVPRMYASFDRRDCGAQGRRLQPGGSIPSALLVGQAHRIRGADARPAMDERPGMKSRSTCHSKGRVFGWMRPSMSADAAACPLRVAEPVVILMVPEMKVYLACHPVSMRLGFDGLWRHVSAQVLDGDPFSGAICFSFVASGPILSEGAVL